LMKRPEKAGKTL